MRIKEQLFKGIFVERPNRFLTVVDVNGSIVESHLPDPGRLKELLTPGAELYVSFVPKTSHRKTQYTTWMVRYNGTLVSLVSSLPNRFVKESLESGDLPMFTDFQIIKPEFTVGRHRFDFLLEDKEGQEFYLEVKSVTFVENGIAEFPDAVTERGRRHAIALQKLVESGKRAGILFVCQRPDAHGFRPMWDRDPKFGKALQNAFTAGVKVWCITVNVTLEEITFLREIPVNLHCD